MVSPETILHHVASLYMSFICHYMLWHAIMAYASNLYVLHSLHVTFLYMAIYFILFLIIFLLSLFHRSIFVYRYHWIWNLSKYNIQYSYISHYTLSVLLAILYTISLIFLLIPILCT